MLLQDAGGSRDGRGTSSGYLAKELKLAVVSADKRGKPTGAALATATLNLADFAGEAAPITQTLALSPGGRLLLTVGCVARRRRAAPAPQRAPLQAHEPLRQRLHGALPDLSPPPCPAPCKQVP